MSGEMTLEEALAPIVTDPSRSALLLDVDGTLAPIVRDPEDASVGELFRRLLVACTESYALVPDALDRAEGLFRRAVALRPADIGANCMFGKFLEVRTPARPGTERNGTGLARRKMRPLRAPRPHSPGRGAE